MVRPELQVIGLSGERAARGPDGKTTHVGARTTYGGWLGGQPAEVQDEILGADRGKLFRSGGLAIDKFTDDTGIVYSLDELESRNPLAFVKANLSIN